MPGNSNIVQTNRDKRLLQAVAQGRVIDREQAKAVAGFGSTTRVNARLLQLVRAGLLKRFFMGTRAGGTKALYALSRKGAGVAEVPGRLVQRKNGALLVGDQFVQHQLALNAIWIQAKFRLIPLPKVQFIRWLAFPSPLSKRIPLIPDGYFELKSGAGIQSIFCEVDLGTESLKVWGKKIALYIQLAATGEFEQLFKNNRFRVLVAVSSERRLESIRSAVRKHTDKLFWFATLNNINEQGLFAPIWRRPEGNEHGLLS